MHKIINNIKKIPMIDYIFIIIIGIGMFIGLILSKKIDASDELWNFQNLYKIYNGYGIYTDTNIIITPLFFYIGLIFMKIFGATLFSFRIYAIFIAVLMYMSLYSLINVIIKKKVYSFTYTTIIIFLLKTTLYAANYNTLAMCFVLIGLTLYFKIYEKRDKISKGQETIYNSLIGVSMFIVFLTKQNIGAFYILSIIIVEFIRKKDLKTFFKTLFIQLSSAFILLLIFLLYMYKTSELGSFLDYIVFGINEFKQNNIWISITYFDFRIMLLIITLISIITTLIICKLNKTDEKISKEKLNKLVDIMIVSLPFLFIFYPIFNIYHVKMATIISNVFVLYLTQILIFDNFKEVNLIKLTPYIINIVIIVMLGYSSIKDINLYLKYKNNYIGKIEASNVFDNLLMDKENISKINDITRYIKEKREENITVIILDKEAALYMIPLKISNGKFDLPFLGNLGGKGEQGLIDELEKLHEKGNIEIFIINDEKDMFWQESKKVRNYIVENMVKKGTIRNFDIYV